MKIPGIIKAESSIPPFEGHSSNDQGLKPCNADEIESSSQSDVIDNGAKRQRSLEMLRASPCKPSRSYLVPYAAHLTEMRVKGYSYRDMQKWLEAHHDLSPSTSTLHHFIVKTLKRLRKAELMRERIHVEEVRDIAPLPETNLGAKSAAQLSHQTRDAIRAVKERFTARMETTSPLFAFDETKPLVTNHNPKQ